MPPIHAAFKALWPEARLSNLLDDSLPGDLDRQGSITSRISDRFKALTGYAVDAGANAVLYTCSAFGPAIEDSRARVPIPVLKPNEAMIELAVAIGGKICLIGTFAPALPSIEAELIAAARTAKKAIEVCQLFVEGALDALQAGNAKEHDERIVRAVVALKKCDVVCFSQFSMQSAAAAAAAAGRIPLLTTPDTAVTKLKQLLGAET